MDQKQLDQLVSQEPTVFFCIQDQYKKIKPKYSIYLPAISDYGRGGLIINNFDLETPNWLINVSSLVSVSLSYSDLSIKIPLGSGELPSMEMMDLSKNAKSYSKLVHQPSFQ
ncbi:hypothetical protein ACFX1X_028910 [Malus domestica]